MPVKIKVSENTFLQNQVAERIVNIRLTRKRVGNSDGIFLTRRKMQDKRKDVHGIQKKDKNKKEYIERSGGIKNEGSIRALSWTGE